MSQTLFLLYRPEPARPMLKTRSVGAHSICARGSLSYRKRARADMESAPTFFVGAERTRVFPCCVCRGDHWSPANLPPQRIFRDSCLVRQAGTGEQCSPLQEFSPVWARNIPARRTVLSPTACGRSPPRRGGQERAVPRVELSPFVGNVIRRGAFYMRPRKFILPQAGTGGYGIRPYVFEAAEHQPSRGVTAGGGYDFRWSVYQR